MRRNNAQELAASVDLASNSFAQSARLFPEKRRTNDAARQKWPYGSIDPDENSAGSVSSQRLIAISPQDPYGICIVVTVCRSNHETTGTGRFLRHYRSALRKTFVGRSALIAS